jgi:hypothetical protein
MAFLKETPMDEVERIALGLTKLQRECVLRIAGEPSGRLKSFRETPPQPRYITSGAVWRLQREPRLLRRSATSPLAWDLTPLGRRVAAVLKATP